jgi:hypothetical protein
LILKAWPADGAAVIAMSDAMAKMQVKCRMMFTPLVSLQSRNEP